MLLKILQIFLVFVPQNILALPMSDHFKALKEGNSLGRQLNCSRVDHCENEADPLGFEYEGPLCGSNGKTYEGFCQFQRAFCKEHNLRVMSYGKCSVYQKCFGHRTTAMIEAQKKTGVFVPKCLPDGKYTPVQCHKGTKYCWCSTALGDVLTETVVENKEPDCKNFTRRTAVTPPKVKPLTTGGCYGRKKDLLNENISNFIMGEYSRENNKTLFKPNLKLKTDSLIWKFNQLNKDEYNGLKRSEYRGIQKVIRNSRFRPKKCAKKFPKFCDTNQNQIIEMSEWLNCFEIEANSKITKRNKQNDRHIENQTVGHFVKLEKGTRYRPAPCKYDQEQAIGTGDSGVYIPKCDKKGKFEPIQCYGTNITDDSWYCFCVKPATGIMIENTSVKNRDPICPTFWPKCPPPEKEKKFLTALRDYYVKYAKEYHYLRKGSGLKHVDQSNVMKEIFHHFDKNENHFIDGKERKSLRKSISKKRDKYVWRCGRKIHVICDINRDKKISLHEFIGCTTTTRTLSSRKSPNDTLLEKQPNFRRKPGEKNPFIEYIKSEE